MPRNQQKWVKSAVVSPEWYLQENLCIVRDV
jgi:hypothetical protein